MTYFDKETLRGIRGRLNACLVLMHDETDASAKEELIQAIAVLDDVLESDDQRANAKMIYQLIGKIIEKLPWIVSLMKDLE